MPIQYLTRSRGRVKGPFDVSTLQKLVRRGVISKHDEISADANNWTLAGDYEELFPLDTSTRSARLHLAENVPPEPPTTEDDEPFFYSDGIHTYGPMPRKLICSLAENGSLQQGHLVWQQGTLPLRATAVGFLSPLLKSTPALPEQTDRVSGRETHPATTRIVLVVASVLVGLFVVFGVLAWSLQDSPQATGDTRQSSSISNGGATTSNTSGSSRAVATTLPAVGAAPKVTADPVQPSLIPNPFRYTGTLVRSVEKEEDVAEVVGFVVFGLRIPIHDGSTAEICLESGSCFAISPKGDLLTNKHVVRDFLRIKSDPKLKAALNQLGTGGAEPMLWVFFKGEKNVTSLVYTSPRFDMAILHTDRQGGKYFALSQTVGAKRGDEASALGFPGVAQQPLSENELRESIQRAEMVSSDVTQKFQKRDFEYTLTKGAVSRTVEESGGGKWIQHEAIIRHGNSGGPLVLKSGVVIGINTRLQKQEDEAQTNLAVEISQLRDEINAHVSGVAWE